MELSRSQAHSLVHYRHHSAHHHPLFEIKMLKSRSWDPTSLQLLQSTVENVGIHHSHCLNSTLNALKPSLHAIPLLASVISIAMALFFKRLAKAAPVAFTNAFGGQPKSGARNFRIPFGAIAAVSGGISYYCFSSENLVNFILVVLPGFWFH